MRDSLEKLNSARAPEMRFRVKTGINTGHVLVGDIGCLKRMDYTIVGEPVNTAKRIETAAEPDQILVGKSTYEKVVKAGKFNLRPSKAIELKGKAKPEELYELVGLA